MRKIVVTGASGKCGSVISDCMAKQGYEVLGVDVAPPTDFFGRTWSVVDLSDFGQTIATFEGAEAVIHFAAIPGDGLAPPSVVFGNNLTGTFNVLEACRILGIQRVVVASSIEVHATYAQFQYVPVDEAHPPAPRAAYGLAKWLAEKACDNYHERCGMSIASFRLPRIMHPAQYPVRLPAYWEQPKVAADCLWAYIDGRDIAEACRRAIDTDLNGHEVFWLSASNTHMKVPTKALLAEYRPEITDVRGELAGTDSAIDAGKARQMLGFEPQHRWEENV